MLKFFKLVRKHKKLATVIGLGLVGLVAFSFLTSLKGQLMLAFLASAFLFAAVSVGGFVYLKTRPRRSVVFKAELKYSEARKTPVLLKPFKSDERDEIYVRIVATTTEGNESKEVYEKTFDYKTRPREDGNLLDRVTKQIEDEMLQGARILQAQHPDLDIQTDDSFRLELDGWRKHDSKAIDAEVEKE